MTAEVFADLGSTRRCW